MWKKFAGKIGVVTGGSTGMGLASVKRFVQEGMDHVFITGRRRDALDAAIAEIGKSVTAIQGDVASLSDLDRSYGAVKSTNAGTADHARTTVRSVSPVRPLVSRSDHSMVVGKCAHDIRLLQRKKEKST